MDKPCLNCGCKKSIKYGLRHCKKGLVQIYFCKVCNRRFTPKDGFRRMKHDKRIITMTLDMYAKGMSLRGIAHHLKMFYDIRISHAGVLYWIQRYGSLIKEYTLTLKPQLSERWYADETLLMFNNRKNWLWNIMDAKTRFWLGDTVSLFRHQKDANNAFQIIKTLPQLAPSVLETDGAAHYRQAALTAFPNIQHYVYSKPEDKNKMQIMERLNGNIKQRTKTMRGLHCARTCRKQMDFLQGYYNFIS